MRFIGDFHIHSKYSRATSPTMDLENLDMWAKVKGIDVLGTGDFTHPLWFEEIEKKLSPAEPGLFKLNKSNSPIRFVLSSEVSCIYSKNGKVRKVHIVILSPSLEACKKINFELDKIGNIDSDGRPILGMDAKDLAKVVFNANENCMVIPAHIWTPWFAVFGSKSGFDSLEECFEEYTNKIFAVETGLSSDPAMNWRLSQLDEVCLISNSDAHSPRKLGREANVFDTEFSYYGILDAIKNKDPKKFLYTIEFFPEEGKYHYDGHADCKINLTPQESKKYKNICPICSKPLTIGVLNRVDSLADRPQDFLPKNAIPFKKIIPLEEIIADSLGVGVASKQVDKFYNNMIRELGNEFKILLDIKEPNLKKHSSEKIADGIIRVRQQKVQIDPGYDGVFGKIKIFSELKKKKAPKQKSLL